MSEQVYFRRMTIGPFRETLVIRLRDLEKSVHEMIQKGQTTQSDTKTWTFVNALFYCATIFTTIGYGTICPITPWGKVATILYSIIGIPLTLMVLTDFGKLFTRMIKRFFKFCRKIFMAKKLKKVRQVGRRATAVPGQFMTVAWDSVNKRFTTVDVPKEDNNNANNVDVENNRYSTGYKSPMFLAPPTNTHQMGPKTPVVVTGPKSPIVVTSPTPPMTAYVETRPGTPNDTIPAASYDDEDEFNLPVSLALLMLLIYMLLGSLIFMKTDKWSILDSFYFVFISMSTIGLGDLTPQNSLVMIIASIYLLFGLALTSMCINVVQEKLSESFHRAKIRIAGNMGLDVQQIMAREGSEQPPDKREKSVERREKSVDKSDKKKEKESDKKDDKNVGFTLQDNNIGKSLKDRREKREKSTDTDTSSRKGT
ncbi:TWiK family of potassium channels protein 18-like protein [Leptotrombidium deliense]|uniref:TWiK family of potassium channels protein 18-like protein n=1 Tax=Leptotrombidium deliense TaxID=299467 RepID=A0A443SG37_9ACAR|nr:TWiK family of potassium channels protein 18-like protein [Leptotrombidium deliense]